MKNKFIQKHLSKILLILGIGTGAGAVGLGIYETVKACDHIKQVKEDLGVEELPAKTIAKEVWKFYIWPTTLGFASVCLTIASYNVESRKSAAALAAWSVSEQSIKDLKSKLAEELGEEKAKEIEQKVDEDKANKAYEQLDPALRTEETLRIWDSYRGTFYTGLTIEDIRAAFNSLNDTMIRKHEEEVSMSDFLDEINQQAGLRDDMDVWCAMDGPITPQFDAKLTSDGKPYIVLCYTEPCHTGYKLRYSER